MNGIMSLSACICIVCVFAEFQLLVDGQNGRGMSFVGESFVRRLCRHAATVSLVLTSVIRKSWNFFLRRIFDSPQWPRTAFLVNFCRSSTSHLSIIFDSISYATKVTIINFPWKGLIARKIVDFSLASLVLLSKTASC